jgi:polyisoprenoid-binding protein YceI
MAPARSLRTKEITMRITGMKSLFFAASAIVAISVLISAAAPPSRQATQATATAAPALAATPLSLTLDPAQSKVHWTLPTTLHTVHGTFDVTRGAMEFDPTSGKASGEIVVDAKSGESGNNSRDARMHKEVLETAKYPDVVFRPTQVEGVVGASGPCDIKVHGTFSVHGADHEVVVLVHAELAGETWKGTGKFDVPYVQWGMKDPSLLLRVKHVVSVEIEMSGSLQPAK